MTAVSAAVAMSPKTAHPAQSTAHPAAVAMSTSPLTRTTRGPFWWTTPASKGLILGSSMTIGPYREFTKSCRIKTGESPIW